MSETRQSTEKRLAEIIAIKNGVSSSADTAKARATLSD
jgi:hypothetical protein